MLQDPFETIVLFLSILIVNQTLADGRVCHPHHRYWSRQLLTPLTLLV